jgi:aspartate kinase
MAYRYPKLTRNRRRTTKMKVFKFGGASLRDANGIQNVAEIILAQAKTNLLVVVSAMDKTTDILERVVALSSANKEFRQTLDALKKYHLEIINSVLAGDLIVSKVVGQVFEEIDFDLHREVPVDLIYDQVVSKGELISSIILHHYLLSKKASSHWIDARDYIVTNNIFREANVNWNQTSSNIKTLSPTLENGIVVTQGFIGRSENGNATTLGREGSDFSAAIFGSSLLAESVTIWKDVPGVMNADPRRFPNAIVFDELPFREAAEMTFYGASVIHPKTIKPLANEGISLFVKSFVDPGLPGTQIHECTVERLPPLVVFKDNQCLISCKVTDYTFVSEQHLSIIFSLLLDLNVRINVMQNSAISFSFCIDFRENKMMQLVQRLQRSFEVNYNTGLTLITIKNYDAASYEQYRSLPGLLLEQSSRSTLQVLVRNGK